MMNSMMMAFSKSMINPRTTSGYTLATTHAMSRRGDQLSELDYFSAISTKKESLFEIVRSYKSSVLKLIHSEHNPALVWQPIYYDRALCADQDMENLRLHIDLKSVDWQGDEIFTLNERPTYV
jgi:hypothetical protein